MDRVLAYRQANQALKLAHQRTDPRVTHTCDSNCDVVQYKDLYVCKVSGNVHRCDAACTLAIEHTDGDVCPVSGIVSNRALTDRTYWLAGTHNTGNPLMMSEEGRTLLNANRNDVAMRKLDDERAKQMAEVERVFNLLLFSDKRQELNRGYMERVTTKQVDAVKKCLQAAEKSGRPAMLAHLFDHLVAEHRDFVAERNAMFTSSAPRHRQLLERVQAVALKTWNDIGEPRLLQQNGAKYRLAVHTLLVMYSSVKGIRHPYDPDVWLLQPIPELADMLPAVKDIHVFFRRQREFSKSQHVFLNHLRRVYA